MRYLKRLNLYQRCSPDWLFRTSIARWATKTPISGVENSPRKTTWEKSSISSWIPRVFHSFPLETWWSLGFSMFFSYRNLVFPRVFPRFSYKIPGDVAAIRRFTTANLHLGTSQPKLGAKLALLGRQRPWHSDGEPLVQPGLPWITSLKLADHGYS